MAMSAVAAGGFPNWVMLEPVVFRRDGDRSFPDEIHAPIRASGVTTWNAQFRIAFSLVEPPLISRLYAQLPGFPGPSKERPLAMVATHRHLTLLRVGTMRPALVQDFFIYDSAGDKPSSSLERLPPCTEPDMDRSRRHGNLPAKGVKRRLQAVKSMGLLCRGDDEFAVAELNLYKHGRSSTVLADIYLFLKSAGKWVSMRLPILHSADDDSGHPWQLFLWQTDAVIPVGDRWLCWIDYYRGILFYDVFGATVSFLHFPLDKFPGTTDRSKACSWLYRGVSAVDAGRALKFVDVARDDGTGYGALKPGAGFTITCHTLPLLGSCTMVRSKDGPAVTSGELWRAGDYRLPREVLMFPQVNMDRPHVVHFLVSDYTYVMKKMWLVAIDMDTRTFESFHQYVNGREDIGTEGEFLTEEKSLCPRPFIPCEFSKYLHFSGNLD